MLGLPGQGVEEGLFSAEFILGLAPEHISCYLLQLEEGTRYAARYREEELDEESQRAVYLAVCDRLEAAGYRQYEISNFAKPGYESRHNLRYWTGAEYLGIGPSAAGYLGGKRYSFPRDLEGWEALRSGTALLSDQVAERLREAGMKCTAVQVTIRDPDFRDLCRQRRLDVPTCVGREIRDAAFSLIRGVWRAGAPVRALTVTAQNLVRQEEAGEQLDLFTAGAAAEREKLERLARAVDGVRRKYGREALSLASEAGKRQTKAPPAPRSSER